MSNMGVGGGFSPIDRTDIEALGRAAPADPGAPAAAPATPEGYEKLDAKRWGGGFGIGTRGDHVAALQTALARFDPRIQPTGIFDTLTVAAVKDLQRKAGLPADGIAGPRTLRALDRALGIDERFPKTGNAFIDAIAPGAVKGGREHGVPASVTIAQAILESGWGRSGLARDHNNYFGVKAMRGSPSVVMDTTEFRNGIERPERHAFRAYASPDESLTHHAQLLATSKYYARAMANKNDADEFVKSLSGIYSTNDDYHVELIQIMKKHDLYRFDRL